MGLLVGDATLEAQFRRASEIVQELSKRPSNEDLLSLYALYKQATTGDVQGHRPGFLDIKGRAKYDAWEARKGISRDVAMADYVKLVEDLCERDRQSEAP